MIEFVFAVCVKSNFVRPNPIAPEVFRLDVATKLALEADKKRDMFEPKASLSRFPIQAQVLWEPSEGGRHPAVVRFTHIGNTNVQAHG